MLPRTFGNRSAPQFNRSAGLLLAASLAAQPQAQPKPESQTLPRTPDGHPDFQGIWTNATLTPLERRTEFVGKATVFDEEALAFGKRDHRFFEERPDLTPAALARVKEGIAIGAEDSEGWERGSMLARVNGMKRTSLIVNPPTENSRATGLSTPCRCIIAS
jgi:hypothetical protein